MDKGKPSAPPSANNAYADAYAEALSKDRENTRRVQRWFAPDSLEWRQLQTQIDGIDDKLRDLGATRDEPNSPAAVTPDVDLNTAPALRADPKAK